ncbi:MAG: histidine kinase [Tannerellaceae bacterium]|nr:histidine kinase [Tannerellaceae bacterium]
MKNKIKGFIAALLFSVGFFAILKWWNGLRLFDLETLIFSMTTLITIYLVNYLFKKLFKPTGKSVAEVKKNLLRSFLLFALLTYCIAISLFAIGFYLLYYLNGWNTDMFIMQFFRNIFPGGIISIFFGILIANTFFFYTSWLQAVDREQQVREENLIYKYQTLKKQVNPHFLFNSLNTLSELIYTDTKRADQYIQKLAATYRYILEQEENQLITLEEELRFVTYYFDLQKERLGDKIELKVQIDNPAGYNILPVSLQGLVENALKHNLASTQHPLRISIRRESDFIIVTNPIQRKAILDDSTETGLKNLAERIKLIMDKEMIVIEENNNFIVKLPITEVHA